MVPSGKWEAPIEAWALSNLLLRNVEAVSVLARTDEVLAVAAWANTRNAVDLSSRILWLLQPTNRFDAEARWMALVWEYVRYFERMATQADVDADLSSRFRSIADQVEGFAEGVTERLPPGRSIPTGVPSVKNTLQSLNIPPLYRVYIEGSQYMHGTMRASSAFRSGLGVEKRLGETTSSTDWVLPLRTCWICLWTVADQVLMKLGKEPGNIEWGELPENLETALIELASNGDQTGILFR